VNDGNTLIYLIDTPAKFGCSECENIVNLKIGRIQRGLSGCHALFLASTTRCSNSTMRSVRLRCDMDRLCTL